MTETARIIELDPANDPARAHKGLDDMLKECVTSQPSTLVIVHEVGQAPKMRYYGRTLTSTEMRGVLVSLLLEVK